VVIADANPPRVGSANSVTSPAGVIRPTRSVLISVNQSAPPAGGRSHRKPTGKGCSSRGRLPADPDQVAADTTAARTLAASPPLTHVRACLSIMAA